MRAASAALGDSRQIAAIAITEIADYPGIRLCRVLACTGDGRTEWTHLLDGIEAWAKRQGCAAVEPVTRPGWARVLAPMGYRKTHIVLEKRL